MDLSALLWKHLLGILQPRLPTGSHLRKYKPKTPEEQATYDKNWNSPQQQNIRAEIAATPDESVQRARTPGRDLSIDLNEYIMAGQRGDYKTQEYYSRLFPNDPRFNKHKR